MRAPISDRLLTVERAELLARNSHGVQKDRDGSLHIDHVRRVAEMAPVWCQRVAWLHDVVEDTPVTLTDLRVIGLPETEVEAVGILTRRAGTTYGDYIDHLTANCDCASHLIARAVKEVDLLDNLARCIRGDEAAAMRYRKALRKLYEAIP